MVPLIDVLQNLMMIAKLPTKIVASCCGHNKYPRTVVCKGVNRNYELFTNITIPRTRNFYKRDSEGYYYIPEISKEFQRFKK